MVRLFVIYYFRMYIFELMPMRAHIQYLQSNGQIGMGELTVSWSKIEFD